MPKLFPMLLLVILAGMLAACANKKNKGAPHLYDGDAPTIRFNDEPETAGGKVNAF